MIRARKESRKPVTVNAEVRNSRKLAWTVDLADLSEGGCRFSLPAAPLSTGEEIELLVAGIGSIRAKVSWRRGDGVGVAFEAPLSNELLSQMISGKPSTPRAKGRSIRPC